MTEMKKYTRLAVLAVLLALLLPAALSCRNGGDAAQTGTTDTAEPVESTAEITEATEPETDAPETAPLSPAAHFEGENVRLSVTQVGTIDRDGDWRIIQGGTTDGKFIYVIVHNGDKTAAAKSRLRKYDISTMEQVAETDPLQVCHGNDIAYKPAENELYVVHCYPNGDTVSVFDADTLAFKRQIKLPVSIYCMSYDETLDCFWVGINGGDTFAKLTSDFKFVKRYMVPDARLCYAGHGLRRQVSLFCKIQKELRYCIRKERELRRGIRPCLQRRAGEHLSCRRYVLYHR